MNIFFLDIFDQIILVNSIGHKVQWIWSLRNQPLYRPTDKEKEIATEVKVWNIGIWKMQPIILILLQSLSLLNFKMCDMRASAQWFQSLHRAFRAERYILNNSPGIDWGFAAHNTVSIFPWEISSAISCITLVKLFIK